MEWKGVERAGLVWHGALWCIPVKGVVGGQRRITIPRIYVVASGLSEGELVTVSLSESATEEESSFLAYIQRGFRIQVPKVEYNTMELSPGKIIEVEIERVKEPVHV